MTNYKNLGYKTFAPDFAPQTKEEKFYKEVLAQHFGTYAYIIFTEDSSPWLASGAKVLPEGKTTEDLAKSWIDEHLRQQEQAEQEVSRQDEIELALMELAMIQAELEDKLNG